MTIGRLTLRRGVLTVYVLALTVATHWPRLHLPGQDAVPLGLDKWGHVLAFGLLALLIYRARLFAGPAQNLLRGMLIALAYAGINECTQSLVPGRTFDVFDPLASAAGVLVATGSYATSRVLRRTDQSFFAHARTMAALTFVSRFFGLGRDITLSFVFGFGWVYDAFAIAFLIPNLFRRLFGEGALAGAFVPQYSKLHATDRDAAERLASITIGVLWLVLAVIALIGFAILFGLLQFGQLDQRGELAVTLTMLSIWYAPMVCVAAICSAMLQVHGRFALPASMPIVLNIMIISAAVIGYFALPAADALATPLLVIIAVLIAGLMQVTIQTHTLRRDGVYLRWYRSTWRGPASGDAARTMFRQWMPTAIGLAVFQVNTMLDGLIAMFFSGDPGQTLSLFGRTVEYPMQTGAVAVLGMAARLYEFPLGVFGIAVATAIFPAISRLAGEREDFSTLIRQGLRLTIFIGLPASVGLLIVREPLCQTILPQIGKIRPGDAQRVAWVLLGYAPAIWAYSMNHILVRAFYAQNEARTPMRVSVAMVVLNITLNLVLIWPLGAAGLAWSTAICAAIQTLILLVLVRRHVDRPIDRSVRRSWGKSLIATAAVVAVIGPMVYWLTPMVSDAGRTNWLGVVGVLGGAVLAGCGTMAAAARLLGMAELNWILSRKAPAAVDDSTESTGAADD